MNAIAGRGTLAQTKRSRGLQNLAFVLLCILLAGIATGAWGAREILSLRTPDIWGLTALGWVLLDACLVLLLAPLLYGPRLVLSLVALAMLLADAVFVLAVTTSGRYTAGVTLLALFVAGLGSWAVLSGANPIRRRSQLRAVAVLAAVSIAASLIAFAIWESASWTYGRSPDGRWTLVLISRGAEPYCPSVAITRTFWSLVDESKIEAVTAARLPAQWVDNRTIEVSGSRHDIYKDQDLTPPA
jgi:hypothetical protein